jgi:hypothetical protein
MDVQVFPDGADLLLNLGVLPAFNQVRRAPATDRLGENESKKSERKR